MTLPVVAGHEDLTLLSDDSGTVFATADALNDYLGGGKALEVWSCWLVGHLHLAETGCSMLARSPSVQVATISDQSTVRSTAFDLNGQVVHSKGLSMDKHR